MDYLHVALLALVTLAAVQVNVLLAYKVRDGWRSYKQQQRSDSRTPLGTRAAVRAVGGPHGR